MKTAILLGLSLAILSFSCTDQGAGSEWDILNQEVHELYSTGKYERAVVVAKKALEVAEKNVGPNHPDVATSLNNLALLYDTQGGIDKLTYRRGLVLLDGECNALNVGANPHSEHDLKSKDA